MLFASVSVVIDPAPPWSTPLVGVPALVAVVLVWQLYAAWHAATHLAPEVGAALRDQGRADLEVELPFEPEKFHLVYFQSRGRVVGVEGQQVRMADVGPDQAREIAGQYWVSAVRPLQGP